MLRTHNCGELTKAGINKLVELSGWVHNSRDHGGLIFIDLRDRYGITQIVFDPKNKDTFKTAETIRKEFIIHIKGKVRRRPKNMENPKLSTGQIEILVNNLEILSKSEVPPFEIDDRIVANEELRLKYRYLDLRRPIMQQRLIFRHKVAQAAREYLSNNNFIEIETPLLVRSTPEGARDYIVPSRVNPGNFYALPQSPQLYKQILMIAGMDRYFQLARCLRDEDLRADRQPEHTQIDIEMSFIEEEDIYNLIEDLIRHIFKKVLKKDLRVPFPRIDYQKSLEEYGTDKPDIRFELKLKDVTGMVKDSNFSSFKDIISNNGIVKCLRVEKDFSRKELDDLIGFAVSLGAKGLAWMKFKNGRLESSIVKFFSNEIQKDLFKEVKVKENDTLLFVADKKEIVNDVLSKIRLKLGKDLSLYGEEEFKFSWITNFPLFEWNEKEAKWDAAHHMFTMPKKEHIKYLESNPDKVYAYLYDLVLNGWELLSGSIRINDPELQKRVMKVIGINEEEADKKFGFLLKAYKYSAPIHGGVGLGFDRLCALLQGLTDIREVIAFPKNKAAQCPMDGCPSEVTDEQLKELGLKMDFIKKIGS